MAQAEIEHVGKLIGNELLFTRPAKVKVEFTYERKFYLGDSTYERIQIPAQRLQNSNLGPLLSYPSILAKQAIDSRTKAPLKIDDGLMNPNYDFKIVFDTMQPLTFFANGDFRDLQTSEIQFATAFRLTEALGFRDGVRPYGVYGSNRKIAVPKYLANYTVEPNEFVAAVVEYPTPLDHLTFTVPKSKFLPCIKLIHGDGFCPEDRYSIAEHASVFGEYGMKLLNHSQLRKNPDFLKKGSRLKILVTNNRFEVRFKDGSKYPLKDDPFSHRRGVFSGSPKDFFLIRGTNAIPLAKRMKDNGMDTIFGPLTLKFFEEIGYSTRRKQQNLILKPSEQGMQVLKVIDPQRERYNSRSAYI